MLRRRTLGETIRDERQKLRLSQAQLADKVYVSKSTVGHWETDRSAPDLLSCIGLAELFHCSLDYLVGLTDKRAINR